MATRTKTGPALKIAAPTTDGDVAKLGFAPQFEDADIPKETRGRKSENPFRDVVAALPVNGGPGSAKTFVAPFKPDSPEIKTIKSQITRAGRDANVTARSTVVAHGDGSKVTLWAIPRVTRARRSTPPAE